MAIGDISVYNEAKAYMIDGGWEAADSIRIDLIRGSGTQPAITDVAPDPTNYTMATTTEGVQTLDTLGNCIVASGATTTFDDTGATVVWASGGGNSTDCTYALVYNFSQAAPNGICFIDLGAARDLTAGSVTITWNASGIFTVA